MLIVKNRINDFQRTTNLRDDPSIAAWDPGASYNIGDLVRYGTYIYSSLMDANTGNQPDIDPVKWYKERPINSYAMFDGFNDTQSVSEDPIIVTVYAAFVDYIALFGVEAQRIRIQIEDAEGIVYDESYEMVGYSITDWWENMYDEGVLRSKLIVKVYPISTQKITITIDPYLDRAACANLAVGLSEYAGCTLSGAKISVRSTTVKDRRGDGRIIPKKGLAYDRITVPVIVDTGMLDTAYDRFRRVDGVPTLFVADARDHPSSTLSVYGFFKDFEMAFGLRDTEYTVEIEGVG